MNVRLPDGRLLFVSPGLSREKFGVFMRKPNGSLQRYNSPWLPMRETREAAEADLKTFAEKNRYPLVAGPDQE